MFSNTKKLLLIVGLLLTLTMLGINSITSASADDYAKQIAAPPEEILAGNFSLPTPDQNGIRSQSAMIPVHLQQAKDGSWQWKSSIPVDTTENVILSVFAPTDIQWNVSAKLPGETSMVDLANHVKQGKAASQMSSLGIGDNQYPATAYTFEKTTSGDWVLNIQASHSAAKNNQPDGYILIGAKSNLKIFSHLNTYDLLVGNQIGLVTYAYQAQVAIDEENRQAKPVALANTIEKAEVHFVLPNGEEKTLTMQADKNNSTFAATIEADVAGEYTAQVTVYGKTADGKAFIRTSQHFFPVLENNLSLAPQVASATAKDNQRLGINLVLNNRSNTIETVQASAEVWGTDAKGTAIPVAWISGMVTPEQTKSGWTLPLNLDGNWIALAKAQGPFELRNVVIQDRNTHIPLATLEKASLNIAKMPQSAFAKVSAITDEMLKGEKPEATNKAANDAAAGVLFLVHGYCSNGAWPTSDFTQYGVFADHEQNRTHDQFAQIIRDQGSVYPSFGTVGSSQGGPATLHLYTYYWSGLDYSSGSRLMQSVGSPYHGSPLSGNIALLGEIFGIMCGANWDLTYDGSSLWLSGIPSWARDDMYYHTVSFEDKWWRYDYCHLASDVLLDDPDDGAVEKWSGQLSGGNNLGHKTGWCHTDDMRDPPYSDDHGRNANMNTYGNR